MTSLLRLTHFIPQSASFTPFSPSIPAISHSVLLILRPEKREKLSNVFMISVAEFIFFIKKVVSSACA